MKRKVNSNDIHPDDKAIGERLAMARERSGLSQSEVAEKAGWFKDELNTPHQQRVSHYETGRRRISAIDLLAYADAVGADPVTLLGVKKLKVVRSKS